MLVRFDSAVETLLRDLGSAASHAGAHAWVVGGAVRDAMVGAPVKDLDITVVGDASSVVNRVSQRWNAVVDEHDAFATATLVHVDGWTVDVVQARRETYPRPGALPDIVPAGLDDDLKRRDFTVNAMAADLSADRFGEVTDPFGGQDDLAAGLLRILHPASFRDDPTRLFRAARHAVRFELTPDNATDEAAREAVSGGALNTVSADRRRREVELLLSEGSWPEAVMWLNRWGVWAALGEGWEPEMGYLKRGAVVRVWALRSLAEEYPDVASLRWLFLLAQSSRMLHRAIKVKPAEERLAHHVQMALSTLAHRETAAWWRTMDDEPLAVLLVALALCRTDSEKHRLTHYLETIRPMRTGITGDDMIAAGAAAGPALGSALRKTLDAVRMGHISSLDAQLDFALKAWRERSTAIGNKA